MDFNNLDLTFDVDPIYFWSYAHQTFLVSMSHPSFTLYIYISNLLILLLSRGACLIRLTNTGNNNWRHLNYCSQSNIRIHKEKNYLEQLQAGRPSCIHCPPFYHHQSCLLGKNMYNFPVNWYNRLHMDLIQGIHRYLKSKAKTISSWIINYMQFQAMVICWGWKLCIIPVQPSSSA